MRTVITVLIALLLIPITISNAEASEDEVLISNVNVFVEDKIVSAFSYHPQLNSYTLYLTEPATITLKVYAPRDTVLISISGHKGYGKLEYSRQIVDEHTIVAVVARENTVQTLAVSFIIVQPEPEEPNIDPGPINNHPNPEPNSNPNNNPPAPDDNTSQPPQNADDSSATEDNPSWQTNTATQTALFLQIDNPVMKINGDDHLLDTAPLLLPTGHTMVPVRFIAEALGAQVSWDATSQKVEIWLDGQYFSLIIGEIVAGTDVCAMIHNSRTMVPLRYIMESFGASVEWIPEARCIFIIYPA